MADEVRQGAFPRGAEGLFAACEGGFEQNRAEVVAVRGVQRLVGEFGGCFDALFVVGRRDGDEGIAPGLARVGEILFGHCHVRR